MEVELSSSEDGKIGAITDDSLRITTILAGSAADGKLLPGDVILTVNGEEIKSREQFDSMILSAGSITKVKISRSIANRDVQVEDEKNQSVPSGFEEVEVLMRLRNQRKLGLFLRQYDSAVIVSRIDQGSISAEILRVDDQFLELDGQRPQSKEEARKIIVRALRKNGQVLMKILRPVSEEAKKAVSEKKASMDRPSYAMNSDVLKIAQREQDKIRRGSRKKVRGILSRRSRNSSGGRVSVKEKHESLVIGMDPSKGPLQHVPKPKQPTSKTDDEDDSE
ncbi:hypothetical protein Tcan_14254 [Toxocara canis]|uniref:PDZ domain-containing protein n=1 Tax=Toxocara canis TaxID=6265 RepID=A0A0B2VNL2_TOXCA|nr:hypothetical protein Tcan_14254 [Toxocara canis]